MMICHGGCILGPISLMGVLQCGFEESLVISRECE
jgi:hypothetical protein